MRCIVIGTAVSLSVFFAPNARGFSSVAMHLQQTPPIETGADTSAGLLLALSWLQSCAELSAPPDWLNRTLSHEMRRMPMQRSAHFAAHAGDAWLCLASVADYTGEFELSWNMLGEIERLLTSGTPQSPELDEPRYATVNLRAITHARRGRIARQRGDVDDAVEWYREGLRLLRNTPRSDGWAQCTLGHATCAQARGNFPETSRRCLAVLRAEPAAPATERCSAHHTLALCYRRRGKLDVALQHAWAAFDLAYEADDRRSQCLMGVTEITLELGAAKASRNGFQVLLSQPQPERIRIPATIGLLAAETLLWTRAPQGDIAPVLNAIDALVLESRSCVQPYERIKAQLGAFEAAITAGLRERADALDRQLADELRLAQQSGTAFHEFGHRHRELRAQLASSDARTLRSEHVKIHSDALPENASPRTQLAFARLTELHAVAERAGR